jgi:hypothetical protein
MVILSLDPGVTTGYVIAEVDKENLQCNVTSHGVFKYPKIDSLNRYSLWGFAFLQELHRDSDEVICEQVSPSGRNFDITPVYVTGISHYYCSIYEIPFIFRIPGFMKAPNLYAKKFLDEHFATLHERDAMAHLISYLGPNYNYEVLKNN